MRTIPMGRGPQGAETSSRKKAYGRGIACLRNNQETGVTDAERGVKIRKRPGWGSWEWGVMPKSQRVL